MSLRSLLLACLLWTPAFSAAAALDENFETIDLGERPQWLTNLTPEQLKVEAGASVNGQAANQRVLHILLKDSQLPHWTVNLPADPPLTGKFSVRCKVKFPSAGPTDVKILMAGPAGQGPYLRMRPAARDAGFSTYDSTFHPLLPQIIPGDWYQVVLDVDLSKQTFSASVDNLEPAQKNNKAQHARAEGLKFSQLQAAQGKLDSIDSLGISRVGGSGADILLDDVQITAENEAPARKSND